MKSKWVRPSGTLIANNGHPINRHQVGAWALGQVGWENSVKDITRNNDGASTGSGTMSRVNSRYGHGLVITGDPTNRRINLGSISSSNPLSMSSSQQITIFSLLYLTGTGHGNDFPRILDKSTSGNAADGYCLFYDVARTGVSFQVDGSLVSDTVNTVPFAAPEKVCALCITYDPALSSDRFKVYINGLLVGAGSLSVALPSATAFAAIGNWNHTTDRQYTSPIYLTRVFDKALSQRDVTSLSVDPYAGLYRDQPILKVSGVADVPPQTLTSILFSNTSTFFTPIVSLDGAPQTLTTTLFTNTNAFYNPVVSLDGGLQTLTASLFTNSNTFYNAVITGGEDAFAEQPVNLTFITNNILSNNNGIATILDTTAVGHSLDNMLSDKKELTWRSSSSVAQQLEITWATSQTCGGVGLAFTNLADGNQVRFSGYDAEVGGSIIFDTGLMDIDFNYDHPTGFSTLSSTSFGFGGGTYFSAFFTEVTNLRRLVINLADTAINDAFYEVSRIVAGKSLTVQNNPDYPATFSYFDNSTSERTKSGNLVINRSSQHKELLLSQQFMPRGDKIELAKIIRRVGAHTPIFVSLQPSETDETYQAGQIYGFFDETEISFSNVDAFSNALRIKEI